MKFTLLPKEEKFFELFNKQAENVHKGSRVLQDLVHNYTNVEARYLSIRAIEHEGDIITHEIFSKSKTSFITPIDREDIHELASGLDDVLDCIEGVGSRLHYFHIEATTPKLVRLVDIIEDAVEQIYHAISSLETLHNAEKFCSEINKLENEADIICQEATSDLFKETETVEQMKNLIKWKEIYRRLETAADRCEDVSNVIEGIGIKNA